MHIMNPFAKAMQRGFEAMLETMQEELGKMSQQLIQGAMDPDMLAQIMQAMQMNLKGGNLGFDMGQFASAIGQQQGFNPYKVLGLEKSATDEEVKKRYHELVHILHPDKSGTPGTSAFFQMVVVAYEAIKQERGWH